MRRTHSISQHCGYMWISPKEHEILFFKAFHIHYSKHSRSIIQNIPNPSWSAYVCLRGVDDPNWLLNVSPHCSICSLFQCISTQCSFPSLVINSTYRQAETYQMYPLVNKHGYWKLPSIVDLPIKEWWFSIVMLVYQRVSWFLTPMSSLPYPIYSLEFTAFFKRQLIPARFGSLDWLKRENLQETPQILFGKSHGKSMENPWRFSDWNQSIDWCDFHHSLASMGC